MSKEFKEFKVGDLIVNELEPEVVYKITDFATVPTTLCGITVATCTIEKSDYPEDVIGDTVRFSMAYLQGVFNVQE